MMIEDQLRERLKKVEALYFGSTSASEREAAGAAADRLRAKLDEAARSDPPVEMKFTLPGRMVGAFVRRSVPTLRRASLPLSAATPHNDHGESAAALFRHRRMAAIFRPAHGPLDLFRADDGAADQRVNLLGHAGRGNGERAEPVALTADQAADLPCSRAAFQFHARSSASWLLVVAPETMRSSTSASHVSGSTPLSFAV